MAGSVVAVRGLEKTYKVFSSPWERLWEALGGSPRHRPFRALENVSFELEAGEALGVVGENGAGKSTLLKILAGVLEPSGGELEVRGKVASILELGSGFHPEFTGRENLLLNAAILGLGRQETLAKLPQILEFSELGAAIDQPVKAYSTGMTMRLAFSIATQVEPDVLIVDEALSVGDGYFQKKSMDRMTELVRGGTTLVFCSHAMYYVSSFCERALWLRQGCVEKLGTSRDVIVDYEGYLLEKGRAEEVDEEEAVDAGAVEERPSGPARLVRVELVEPREEATSRHPGEPWALEVSWECDDENLAFQLGVGVNRSDGTEVFSCETVGVEGFPLTGARRYVARLCVPRLPLVKGDFEVYVHLGDEKGLHVYDRDRLSPGFVVRGETYSFGLVQVEHRWEVEECGSG